MQTQKKHRFTGLLISLMSALMLSVSVANAGIMMVPKNIGRGAVAYTTEGWELHDLDSDGIVDVAEGQGLVCNYFSSSRLWRDGQRLKNMPCTTVNSEGSYEVSLTRGIQVRPDIRALQEEFQRVTSWSSVLSKRGDE